MPTFAALLAASVVGWLIEGPIRATMGIMASTAVGLLVSAATFFIAKRILTDLRG